MLELMMPTGSKLEPVAAEALSALVDGEVDASMALQVCAAWRDDAAARSTWHAYQLIGDVLRSEDLASTGSHDVAFMQSLRSRLAQEPVVLAPQPLERGPAAERSLPLDRLRRRRTWMASSAVAAGFVAVAGVVVVLQRPEPGATPALSASSETPAASAPVALAAATPGPRAQAEAEPPLQSVNGQLIRDARLDRYLAAHKQFAGSSVLGVPSSFLRSATVDAAGSR